jgi:DNA repair exonuclease SbcCD ATPase subunit
MTATERSCDDRVPALRTLIWPLSACVLMAGCATQQQTASLECGAGGAGIAFALCKAMGNSNSKCAELAAAGGAVGAVACYSYASRLAKRRQELAGRENDLDARLKYVRGLNEDGQRLNAELQEHVNVAAQHTADLQAQIGKNQVSAQQLASERQRLDGEVKAASQQVALQSDALKELKTYQAQRKSPSPELDAEIAKQERLLAQAKQEVDKLASYRERVPSG